MGGPYGAGGFNAGMAGGGVRQLYVSNVCSIISLSHYLDWSMY
jgi:hypothetical protein